MTIRLIGEASARLQLYRGQRKIAEKTFTGLDKGTRMLRLDIPRSAGGGTFRVGLRLTDACGDARAFTKNVTVSRR